MIGETVYLQRITFVSTKGLQKLIDSKISANFEEMSRKAQHGRKVLKDLHPAEVVDVGANVKGSNPYVSLRFKGGVFVFRLNTGIGEKPVLDWMIHKDSLERLRDFARGKHFRVAPVERTRSRKTRGARRPKNIPKEQVELFQDS